MYTYVYVYMCVVVFVCVYYMYVYTYRYVSREGLMSTQHPVDLFDLLIHLAIGGSSTILY